MNTLPRVRKTEFKPGDVVYYPPQGVGTIADIANVPYDRNSVRCYVIHFPRSRMTAYTPITTANKNGMQLLSSFASHRALEQAYNIIAEPRKKPQGVWNRRDREITQKITSDDLIRLAEAIRDTNRDLDDLEENTYSELQLLKQAALRLADVLAHRNAELEDTAAALADINERIAKTKRPLAYQYWLPKTNNY